MSNKRKRKKMRGGDGLPPSQHKLEQSTKQEPSIKVPKKSKFGAGKRVVMEWFNINRWLDFSKLFYFIGFIIAIISLATGSEDGLLVAYYWITGGVAISFLLSTIVISMNKNISGVFNILKVAFPIIFPSMFLLLPLIALIYILTISSKIIKREVELPWAYSKFNGLVLAFVVFQCILLSGFYKSEITHLSAGRSDPNRWAYASGLVLATVLTCAGVAELYVIIKSFFTDG